MALLALSKLKAILGVSDSTDDAQWSAILPGAEGVVKNYLRWNPERNTAADIYLDGTGLPELWLCENKTYPGLVANPSFTAVYVDVNGAGGQAPGAFAQPALTQGVDYIWDAARGTLRMWRPQNVGWFGWPWGRGPTPMWRNLAAYGGVPAYWPRVPLCVKVSGYSNGYSVTPPAIENAVAEVAAWMKNTQELGGLQETSISYIDTSSGLSAGTPTVNLGDVTIPVLGTALSKLAAYRLPVGVPGGIRT